MGNNDDIFNCADYERELEQPKNISNVSPLPQSMHSPRNKYPPQRDLAGSLIGSGVGIPSLHPKQMSGMGQQPVRTSDVLKTSGF